MVTTAGLALALLTGCAKPAMDAPRAPPGYYLPVTPTKPAKPIGPASGSHHCQPLLPPFTDDLQFSSKYEGSDSARDQFNAEANQRYKNATATVVAFEKSSVTLARHYLSGKAGPQARYCLLNLLAHWSAAEALLSTQTNHTGNSVRKWTLASVGSAYLLVKLPSNSPAINPQQQQLIEQWLSQLANQVRLDWSDRPVNKRNNHDYWAAWAVMVASVAVGDSDLFEWALQGLDNGLAQINADGYLPNELKRNTRALNYHNYSLPPLVMLAVFAEANGRSLSAQQRTALLKLVTVTIKGIDDPSNFEMITGSAQMTQSLVSPYSLAWMEPYARYFGSLPEFKRLFDQVRPMVSTRMGGDMTRLFASPLAP